MRRITVEVGQENEAIGVYVQNMEPYDSIVALLYTALALLEGRAQVSFGDGSPLTDGEEQDNMSSSTVGSYVGPGGQRDN
jgi:hypothetical protein